MVKYAITSPAKQVPPKKRANHVRIETNAWTRLTSCAGPKVGLQHQGSTIIDDEVEEPSRTSSDTSRLCTEEYRRGLA
jgi:hypothetical protein